MPANMPAVYHEPRKKEQIVNAMLTVGPVIVSKSFALQCHVVNLIQAQNEKRLSYSM
jgi:hypothetical protein